MLVSGMLIALFVCSSIMLSTPKIMGAAPTSEYDVDSDTVALWHFNEGTGATITDETTNDNDGTIYGATWDSGKFGSALTFDGSNDYASVTYDGSLNLPVSGLTIEAWIKADDVSRKTFIVNKLSSAVSRSHYRRGYGGIRRETTAAARPGRSRCAGGQCDIRIN